MDNSRYKFRAWFPCKVMNEDVVSDGGMMGLVTNLKGSNVGYTFDGVVAECFIEGRQVFYEAYQNFVLMQFTGLKDKNGVEIYEGDIIEATTKSGKKGLRGVVEWEDYGWTVFRPIEAFEVIGNIYENPELLKV